MRQQAGKTAKKHEYNNNLFLRGTMGRKVVLNMQPEGGVETTRRRCAFLFREAGVS
ncbi:hypothetical protein GTCCBUS3UF5_18820 [Geobacillus thermoleovorans CCB_US3_UF5]|uniref:Uncharacterized protein n=3 Tax=Geobacillus TaxID=129337 RepID=U2Y6A9_GEOKU|nr:hypothetical protein GTCCBUS3UF5_18820 [Geobacillus thermoleovorans CCB_US3_UF5]GAD14889.1 hypothetical protein GBL_3106 [Geobacillus kaustophilus GBlys]GAJ59011.1 hypothetical protein B23_2235 [Geobacillus thermoleovorans B23]